MCTAFPRRGKCRAIPGPHSRAPPQPSHPRRNTLERIFRERRSYDRPPLDSDSRIPADADPSRWRSDHRGGLNWRAERLNKRLKNFPSSAKRRESFSRRCGGGELGRTPKPNLPTRSSIGTTRKVDMTPKTTLHRRRCYSILFQRKGDAQAVSVFFDWLVQQNELRHRTES
jgi:hypothetical protein